MADAGVPRDFRGFTEETREIWNENADWWDQHAGDGGLEFQRTMIDPATARLLALCPGELVLDLACGNGASARKMAEAGARVVAVDFSERLIAHARLRTTKHVDRIDYRVMNLTDEDALRSLGARCFDAAVCTMALFDIADIEPLGAALPGLLRDGGRFVFSVTHPCFNTAGVTKTLEEQLLNGRFAVTRGVKIVAYLRPTARTGLVGPPNQPVPHYYFDRPLGILFGTFFRGGLMLDALEEPAVPAGAGDGGLSWRNYTEIPPVLIARMRV
ncbi:MAG TPA: class I SAM-dependent methyltransferase [bacterium]|nr:class I SAM-dependent methyltransferase [bacterium]